MVLTIAVLACELLVMFLGYDIILAGLRDLVYIKAGAETLVSVACIASLLDVSYMAIASDFSKGTPFCAVAACSLFFAMLGAYKTARGYMLTFRVASAGSKPYCVTVENDRVEGGGVLVKNRDSSEGFVTRCHRQTLVEKLCVYTAPLLLLGSLGLALMASIGTGRVSWFFRCFAAMSAVCAPFSLMLVFGHPFRALAKRLSAAGAAIAGWQGACDCAGVIGLVIRDEDIFPSGALSIGGVTVVAKIPRDKLVSYTGSLIIESGSGLSETFAEFIKAQRGHVMPVSGFTCYEGGGLSGMIGADRVLVGSSGFMNLMGIRLQENLHIKNGIYCAINDRLAGVFLVNYNPMNSVQAALMSILGRKILPLFATRDFNITTMMLSRSSKSPRTGPTALRFCRFPSVTAFPSRRRKRSSPPPLSSGKGSHPTCRRFWEAGTFIWRPTLEP